MTRVWGIVCHLVRGIRWLFAPLPFARFASLSSSSSNLRAFLSLPSLQLSLQVTCGTPPSVDVLQCRSLKSTGQVCELQCGAVFGESAVLG
eukprot:2991566-Amphidinium_carterae.1